MSTNHTQRLEGYNSYSGCDMVASMRISSHNGLKNNIYMLGSLQTISISTHQDKMPVRAISNINAKEYTMGQRTIAGSLVFAVFDKHFANQVFKDSIDAAQIGTNTIILPDELPPFDITITYANEYGHTSRMALYGVRLINEGLVMSINDIYTENTYQFVATGLEPLSKDQDIGSAQRTIQENKIEAKDEISAASNIIIDEIVSSLNTEIEFNRKTTITLSVDTENANSNLGFGIAKFYLNPNQTSGLIRIRGGYNTEETIINLFEYPNSKIYYAYLPIGNYYAQYEDIDKTSNVVSFKIDNTYEIQATSQDIPIIEDVTNNSITISVNDKTHDTAIIYSLSKNNNETSVSIKSKKAVFTNLEPDSLYYIYTCNSLTPNTTSIINSVSTLKHEKQFLEDFKDFIKYNSSLLIKQDIDKYFSLLDNAVFKNNIIDLVLNINLNPDDKNYKTNNEIKNELLFFAIKFQNLINADLNKFNEISQPVKSLNKSFYDTLKFSNKSHYNNYYRKENTRNIFELKVEENTYTFNSYNNKRYYCYSVDTTGTRGPRYDFCNFSYEAQDYLKKYSNSNVLSLQDTSYINSNYNNNLSKTNLDRLTAQYYKKPNIKLLIKPMVQVNEDLNVVITTNYLDVFEENTELLICFAQANESLDTTPFKKVKCRLTNDDIIINSYDSGIKLNDTYLVWIEQLDQTIISTIESFNTYINDYSLNLEDEYIKYNDIEKEITYILTKLSEKTKVTTELKEIIESIKDDTETHEVNLYDKIIYNIISNKYIFSDVLTLLGYIYNIKLYKEYFINENMIQLIKLNKTSNNIVFETDANIDLSVTYIDEFEGYTSKSIVNSNTVELNKTLGYTVVFAVSKNKITKSGFIIIDNKTKDYVCHNIKVEVR